MRRRSCVLPQDGRLESDRVARERPLAARSARLSPDRPLPSSSKAREGLRRGCTRNSLLVGTGEPSRISRVPGLSTHDELQADAWETKLAATSIARRIGRSRSTLLGQRSRSAAAGNCSRFDLTTNLGCRPSAAWLGSGFFVGTERHQGSPGCVGSLCVDRTATLCLPGAFQKRIMCTRSPTTRP